MLVTIIVAAIIIFMIFKSFVNDIAFFIKREFDKIDREEEELERREKEGK